MLFATTQCNVYSCELHFRSYIGTCNFIFVKFLIQLFHLHKDWMLMTWPNTAEHGTVIPNWGIQTENLTQRNKGEANLCSLLLVSKGTLYWKRRFPWDNSTCQIKTPFEELYSADWNEGNNKIFWVGLNGCVQELKNGTSVRRRVVNCFAKRWEKQDLCSKHVFRYRKCETALSWAPKTVIFGSVCSVISFYW